MLSHAAQAWLRDTRVAGLSLPGEGTLQPGATARGARFTRWLQLGLTPLQQITQKGCHGEGPGSGLQHLKGSEH